MKFLKQASVLAGYLAILCATSAAAAHGPFGKFLRASGKCPADALCGVLMRPLDPSGQVKGRIPITYRLYLHTDRAAQSAGTIVAQEGGPGYPTIASRYGYLRLFAPLRRDHDILMVNARGTGDSAIHCPNLQTVVRKPQQIGECGRRLGRASTLYGTRHAAEDLAAVLDKLGIGQVDYYGDSYGTFFGQVFSAVYPQRLRSVVLDGAYPVIGETPWYSHAGEVVRRGFRLVCQRSSYCASLQGDPLVRIRRLVRESRKNPIHGRAADGDGRMRDVTVDPGSIGLMLYGGGQGPVNYRDLDAAIRALHDGDRQPLLRLIAENNA
ncbi:MAG: alpha/beta fold hydrolase, partial [Sinobacteraceae bacterium]|nr:alpha/beta fold hydrolase [Nevskiaceae bacterium]